VRDPDTLPPKKDVARGLLLRGTLFVHLDPRVEGAVVPPWLRQQPQLVLQVGLDMPIPISDLRIDDEGVYGTLSFNRAPFTCVVPWSAVFAVVGDDGRGMVWPTSMPAEIRAEVEREAGLAAPAPTGPDLLGEDADPGGADGDIVDLTARRTHAYRGQDGPEVAEPRGPAVQGAPTPRPRGRSRARKGGRELPPYLRVVK
jgi:stringent starvation protein B